MSWWNHNPTEVVSASFKAKWYHLLLKENRTLAHLLMVVGKKVGDHSKGGIGGFVKFFNGCNILEFAGPSIANSALQAEKQALLQMVDLLANSQWSSERILILSDNKELPA